MIQSPINSMETPLMTSCVSCSSLVASPAILFSNMSSILYTMLQVSYTTVENCPPVVLHVLVSMWQVMNVAGVMISVQ